MKTFSILFVLPALVAGVGWSVFANDAPTPRTRGAVLLLVNERTFEGDIEKVGELYRVRKAAGEVVVPISQAIRLCADWDEALAFMRSRANLGDPDERLRLAKWCQLNHQIERARIEAKVALEMRPKHRETQQLVKLLEATPISKNAAPIDDPLPPLPRIDLSFASVTAFSQKVQPILMNTCISCHCGTYTGKFRLYRLNEGGDRIATQRNLAAVLAQVSLDKPAASPLLVMAVSAHGNAKTSPLSSRQAPTFQAICTWLDETVATNPQLREQGTVGIPGTLPASVTKVPAISEPAPSVEPPTPAKGAATPASLPGVVVSQATPLTPPQTTGPAAEALGDLFAPGPFNRWAHPEKK